MPKPGEYSQELAYAIGLYVSRYLAVPKPLPSKHVTLQDRQARAFDWNAGPSITPLSLNDVSNDLLAMGVSRLGSSTVFPRLIKLY